MRKVLLLLVILFGPLRLCAQEIGHALNGIEVFIYGGLILGGIIILSIFILPPVSLIKIKKGKKAPWFIVGLFFSFGPILLNLFFIARLLSELDIFTEPWLPFALIFLNFYWLIFIIKLFKENKKNS